MIIRGMLLLCAVLALQGTSFAHEGHAHGHEQGDTQMARLHKMMPRYQNSQQSISAALEKGDVATVEQQTSYLLSTIPDLKKSKPHKGGKDLGKFRTLAEQFRKDIQVTAALAQKGDMAGAKASFTDAQKQCNACHSRFRD